MCSVNEIIARSHLGSATAAVAADDDQIEGMLTLLDDKRRRKAKELRSASTRCRHAVLPYVCSTSECAKHVSFSYACLLAETIYRSCSLRAARRPSQVENESKNRAYERLRFNFFLSACNI